MPAGGRGDEPFLDIVVYKIRVFSEKADNLVRDLSVLMDFSETEKFRFELGKIRSDKINIGELESQLETRKKLLITRAIQNGLDLELLESEMQKRKTIHHKVE